MKELPEPSSTDGVSDMDNKAKSKTNGAGPSTQDQKEPAKPTLLPEELAELRKRLRVRQKVNMVRQFSHAPSCLAALF